MNFLEVGKRERLFGQAAVRDGLHAFAQRVPALRRVRERHRVFSAVLAALPIHLAGRVALRVMMARRRGRLFSVGRFAGRWCGPRRRVAVLLAAGARRGVAVRRGEFHDHARALAERIGRSGPRTVRRRLVARCAATHGRADVLLVSW